MIVRQSEAFRGWAIAAAVFVLALALRLLAVRELGELPISRTPQLDSAVYLSWARAIVADWSFWPEYPEHSPGYPYFLAVVLSLFDSLTAVRVLQSIIGASACVLTARVAARTISPNAALAAGLIQAAYAPLIYIDTAILSEGLLLFLLIASLDFASGAGRSRARWLAAGTVLGCAIVVRPTAIVLLPAYAFVVWRNHTQEAIRLAAAMIAGSVIVVAPVVIQNWRASGIPLVQGYGGMNFYLGNRPSGDGMASARLGGEWDALEGAASRAGTARNDQDAYYVSRTLDEIGAQPGAYIALLTSKVIWTFQDEELRDTHSYYFFSDAMPLLHWLPSFGLVLALAVAGLTAPAANRSWLLAYSLAMLLTMVFLVVGTRYRMPLLPPLFALAGAGVTTIINAIRAREMKRAGTLSVIAIAVLLISEIRSHDASRNLAEEWSMTGLSLLHERKFEEAEAAYRTAIGLGESSFAWDGLGLVLQRRELRTLAREAFERAVQINPRNATAWVHLGFSYEFLGNGRAAIAAYQKALEITPQRAEAMEMLDAALRRYR